MGRPKASEARDTRREVMDAALELFAQQGFHGTGLRDIARAVGVRESAIYHHFAGKESLLEAILSEAPEGAPAHVRSFAEAPLPAAPELAPFFEGLLCGLMERAATLRERKRFRLMMNDGLRLALEGKVSFLERVGGGARAEMQRLLHRLVEAGVLQGDPELLGVALVAPVIMWRQMLELSPSHRFCSDFRAFARAHVANFLGGARGGERPAKPVARSAEPDARRSTAPSASPRSARTATRTRPGA